MGKHVATTIVEPRLLVREALASLLASHSYHVVGGVASTADIDDTSLAAEAPKLVILGALPTEDVATAASSIRKLWPEAKIILLFEHASPADLQRLLASEIDGCIPLSASQDTLIGALQQIIAVDLRILVLKTAACSSMPANPDWQEEADELDTGTNALGRSDEVENGATDRAFSVRIPHGLTEREEQILRGLVKGHSNKMIARKCASTEATVKVHVKSILRKIRVANRTQAAIWALEQGYCANASKDQAIAGAAAQWAPNHGRVEADASAVIGMAAD
jgi:two-component system, NarL family, nitrate/nitrite response regulator NarL